MTLAHLSKQVWRSHLVRASMTWVIQPRGENAGMSMLAEVASAVEYPLQQSWVAEGRELVGKEKMTVM